MTDRTQILTAPDTQQLYVDQARGVLAEAVTSRRGIVQQRAHLANCIGHPSNDPDTCEGPSVSVPVPGTLSVREGQLLEARIVRVRDSEQPEDEVFIQSGGNGTSLTPEAADQLADQLVTFAAQVRRMARLIEASEGEVAR